MATTKAFSLYDHICAFKSKKDYQATRLARYLIQVLSRDTCLTKWEASSLSQILVGARVRYDEIHEWIGIVGSEQQVGESIRWDAFGKYTDGLDALERALFDLAVALDKENELFIQLELQINGEFSDLAIVMELLEQVIEQAMGKQSLFSASGFNRTIRRLYILMSGWVLKIKSLLLKEKGNAHLRQTLVHLQFMLDQIREWDQTGIALDVARIRIRTAFSQALYILSVLRLLNKKTTLTEEIWIYFEEEAKNLCTGVGFDKPGGDGWSKLMIVIRKIVEITVQVTTTITVGAGETSRGPGPKVPEPYKAKLPKYYADMKRKAAEIRRPYFSQAVTIIRMCEALAQVLEVQVDQVAAEKEIELAFHSAQAVLLAAINAASGFQGIVSQKTARVSELFIVAQNSLRSCFTSFKIQEQWSRWEAMMAAAMTRDAEHLALFEKRIQMVAEHENPHSTEMVTIQLELVQKEVGTGRWQKQISETVSYQIPSDATLQTLLSMEASRNTRFHGRIANLSSYFASEGDITQMRSPIMKLSEIQPSANGARSLRLVLADETAH
ncbi:hypothetical protein Moror_14637 [Moniliophthora roreri MCA 2997]|nr:hypothetical protein Moror_14637 [Moniliophthora roreri MCA 2997]